MQVRWVLWLRVSHKLRPRCSRFIWRLNWRKTHIRAHLHGGWWDSVPQGLLNGGLSSSLCVVWRWLSSSLPYVSLHRMSHNVEACFIRVSKEKVEGGGWQWESRYFRTKSWAWRSISFIRDKSWGLALNQGEGFGQEHKYPEVEIIRGRFGSHLLHGSTSTSQVSECALMVPLCPATVYTWSFWK